MNATMKARAKKKPGLTLRLAPDNSDTVELLDEIDLPQDFEKCLLQPYFTQLYDSLEKRVPSQTPGISKTTLLEVGSRLKDVSSWE